MRFPRYRISPVPTKGRCFGFGKVWATIAAHGNCTRQPNRSCSSIKARFRATYRRSIGCPELEGTLAALSFPLPSMTGNPFWKRTPSACTADYLLTRVTRTPKRAKIDCGTFAEAVLPRKEIGTFNQALMELGSTICTPKSPRCLICPASAICPTHAAGLQREIPRAKRPTQYEQIDETAIVVFKKNRVLLRRCQEGERWAGLWDFPRFRNSPRTTLAPLKRLTGIEAKLENKLAEIRHGVTRYRITLTCHRATYTAGRLRRGAELAWVAPSALEKYPLSVTGRKISQLLVGTNAQE